MRLVLYAFVDESERDEAFYFLGALVLNEPQLEILSNGLKRLVVDFSLKFPLISHSEELHGSAIMRSAEDPWRDIPFRAKVSLYRDCLRAIERSGARCFIEGINRAKHLEKPYKTHFNAREVAFSFLLERINSSCNSLEPRIQIIADEHHTAEQSRSNFRDYQIAGTFGYRSSRLPNIESVIEFESSAEHKGLQAADLITYLFNRLSTVEERNPKTQKIKELLWAEIAPALSVPRGRARIWP